MRIIFFIATIAPFVMIGQPSENAINRVMTKINILRSSGCQCGNEKLSPVGPVQWDDQLYAVSKQYAKYMHRHNHFEHLSKNGEDLGDRLDRYGYKWHKIGENLGYGYDDFNEVLKAWIESPSHCRMLMDPDVTHMGLSKKGTYWVQSFARPESSISYGLRKLSYDKL